MRPDGGRFEARKARFTQRDGLQALDLFNLSKGRVTANFMCALVPSQGGDSDTRQLFNLAKKSHNESQRLQGETKQIQSSNEVN